MCPGFTPARQAVVWWTYSVTLDLPEYTAEDADGAVQVVEQVLRSDLLGLLQCDNPTGRMLASDFGIVGIDFLPDDLREEGKNDESNYSHPSSPISTLNSSHPLRPFAPLIATRMLHRFDCALLRLYRLDVHLFGRGCRPRYRRP
jgi:hypothetical protein